MKRLFCFFCLLLIIISAKSSDFEDAREKLSEKSLPLVNVTVDLRSLNKKTYVDGIIEIVDVKKRTADEEYVKYLCKYKIRGASSHYRDKKSLAVKLYDEDGKDLDVSVFGIRKENNWILDAMAIDRARMRNRVCFDVWNKISKTPYKTDFNDRNGTEGVFVEVFLNGTYHGLYCMSDKIDRKLLGLKKIKADDTQVVKGVLYKGINWAGGCDLLSYEEMDMNGETWNSWELQYPDDYPSALTWQPLADLIDFCSDQTDDETFLKEYEKWFYSKNLVDYIVFMATFNIGDAPYKNTFLSTVNLTKSHRYTITPWDMDMSLGGYWNGDYYDYLASVGLIARAPFNRLYRNNLNGFADDVAQRWNELRNVQLSVDSVCSLIDAYGESFMESGAWQREYEKWNNNPVPLKADIKEELEYVKDWYGRNYENLCKRMPASSVTLNPKGFATLSSDRNIRVSGAQAYTCTVSNDGTNIDAQPIEDNTVPAYNGVLLYGAPNATVTLNYRQNAASLDCNELKATTTENGLAAIEEALVLNGSVFEAYKGTSFDPDKAYLPMAGVSGAKSLSVRLYDEGGKEVIAVTFADVEQTNSEVKKVMINGMLMIETADGVFTMTGVRVK